MWGANNQQNQERFFPVEKEKVFAALLKVVQEKFKVKEADDFTMSITFSSGASAFTWGENFSAQVLPREGGAAIEIYGVGKVGGQIQQSTRTNKLINQILSDTTDILKAERG
ncbi:hypothetical protein MCEMRE196_00459 [Candidatus Nanopelagicaceae bacterium]